MQNDKLTIKYGDIVLYDEVPEEFQFTSGAGRIRVEAGAPAANPLGQIVQKAMATSAARGGRNARNGAPAEKS